MPAKNAVKKYLQDGYYHIYNRGVEKRTIFQDEQDYKVFFSYLKDYLEPQDKDKLRRSLDGLPYPQKEAIIKIIFLNNFVDEIDLLAFCLMPNHFHLLIKQKTERGIEDFMRSLGTRYVMYFNKRYKRVGSLFQGRYKAVLVDSDEQLLHLSRYIHLNPKLHKKASILNYEYSSLPSYLGRWQAGWLKPDEILDFFSKGNKRASYKDFVIGKTSEEPKDLFKLLIDS